MDKTIVIIGATSAIAEQCARLWSLQPNIEKLILIGRDANKLQAILDDLSTRNPKIVYEAHTLLNFSNETMIKNLIITLSSTPIDMVLIAHGTLGDQPLSESDLKSLKHVININALSVAIFAESVISMMIKQGYGTLGIIASVAGDKARKRNYHYGAAKSFVNFIAMGLQHRLVGTKIKVCLIKPGPTRTPMTIGLKYTKLASTTEVAKDIVKGMARGRRIIYSPRKWRYIMFIVVHLPWYIFKRLDI